jgi:hypothetical protein
MSVLLERILADVDKLGAQEKLKVAAYVITGLQENPDSLPRKQLGRQELFGCLRGQITMAEDFNAPLSDFVGYME